MVRSRVPQTPCCNGYAYHPWGKRKQDTGPSPRSLEWISFVHKGIRVPKAQLSSNTYSFLSLEKVLDRLPRFRHTAGISFSSSILVGNFGSLLTNHCGEHSLHHGLILNVG